MCVSGGVSVWAGSAGGVLPAPGENGRRSPECVEVRGLRGPACKAGNEVNDGGGGGGVACSSLTMTRPS